MANSPLENIYERIKEAGGYHPMTANTFADWALEAGDVVNVSRDGRTYNVPVHTSKLKWNGKQEVEIETTGKRERDSIAKESQRKYGGRGASGLRNGQGMYDEAYDMYGNVSRLWNTAQGLYHEVYDSDGNMARLAATAKGLYHEVYDTDGNVARLAATAKGLYHEVYDTDGNVARLAATAKGLYHEVYDSEGRVGRLQSTAKGLYHEVYDSEGRVGRLQATTRGLYHEIYDTDGNVARLAATAKGLYHEVYDSEGRVGKLELTAKGLKHEVEDPDGRVSRVTNTVDGFKAYLHGVTDEEGHLTEASIATALDDEGKAGARIDGAWVQIGSKGTANVVIDSMQTTINGKLNVSDLTADYLDGKISNISVVHVKSIQPASGATNANISLHSVTAMNRLYVGSGQGSVELIGSGIKDAVTDLNVVAVGNNYKLQKKTIQSHSSWTDVATFSRAVSLSGGWNSGLFSVSATAGAISGTAPSATASVSNDTSRSVIKTAGTATGVSIPYNIKSVVNGTGDPVIVSSGMLSGNVADLLQDKNVTSNQTVTADGGYVGLKSVTVNVSTTKPSLSGSWSNGKFSVSANPQDGVTGTLPSATAFVENDTSRNVQKTADTTTGVSIPYNIKSYVNGSTTKTQVASGTLSGNIAKLLQEKTGVIPRGREVEVTPGSSYVGLSRVTIAPFAPNLKGTWSGTAAEKTYTVQETITDTAFVTKFKATADGSGGTSFRIHVTGKAENEETYSDKTTTTLYLKANGATVSVYDNSAGTGTAYASMTINTALAGTWPSGAATLAERTYTVKETKSGATLNTVFTAVPATGPSTNKSQFYIRVASKGENDDAFVVKSRTNMYLSATGLTVTVHDNDSGSGTAYATILTKPLDSDVGVGGFSWYGEGGTYPSATTLSGLGTIINNNHRGYAYFTVSVGTKSWRYRIPIN